MCVFLWLVCCIFSFFLSFFLLSFFIFSFFLSFFLFLFLNYLGAGRLGGGRLGLEALGLIEAYCLAGRNKQTKWLAGETAGNRALRRQARSVQRASLPSSHAHSLQPSYQSSQSLGHCSTGFSQNGSPCVKHWRVVHSPMVPSRLHRHELQPSLYTRHSFV